jgi:hypothetical protein
MQNLGLCRRLTTENSQLQPGSKWNAILNPNEELEAGEHEPCANLRQLKASIMLTTRDKWQLHIADDDHIEGSDAQEPIDGSLAGMLEPMIPTK